MGLTSAKVALKNPRKPDLQPVEVDALADSGSVHLCIPLHIQFQLGLEEVEKKEATLFPGPRPEKVAPAGRATRNTILSTLQAKR